MLRLALLGLLFLGVYADDDWPPIYEPWRCLEDPGAGRKFTMKDVMLQFAQRDDEDCPLVTDEICEEPEYYAMPCK